MLVQVIVKEENGNIASAEGTVIDFEVKEASTGSNKFNPARILLDAARAGIQTLAAGTQLPKAIP